MRIAGVTGANQAGLAVIERGGRIGALRSGRRHLARHVRRAQQRWACYGLTEQNAPGRRAGRPFGIAGPMLRYRSR
jgi:hypothetical protein